MTTNNCPAPAKKINTMNSDPAVTIKIKPLQVFSPSWPIVAGKEITTEGLKSLGFSIITNNFREVDSPYVIDGKEVMIPVPIPTYEIRRKNLQGAIRAKGGYITIKASKGKTTVVGVSNCHPSEHFCKSVGIKLATCDVVKQLVSIGAL